jgi:hypothetical protein
MIAGSSKARGQAHCKASRRTDSISGEKTAEVDYVEHVIKVLSVNLETHIQAFLLVEIRTR